MLEILHEDNHCLAVNKPAGLLAQGDATGDESLVSRARAYLKARYQKPGNVYIGLVHRLDRPTSGVVILAKTSKGAARLSEQFRVGSVEKTYWAVIEGEPDPESGEWFDRLEKDRGANRVRVVDDDDDAEPEANDPAGREARMTYRRIGNVGRYTLMELTPKTGRGHQLRVQLASRGMPIVGDRKYGSRILVPASDGGSRILLHAREIRFIHPTSRESISVVAPLPRDWPSAL
jgi:23S rRNA pseudouridine1911/1915/1917 synthase